MRKVFTQARVPLSGKGESQTRRDEEGSWARPPWLGAFCSFFLPTLVSSNWGSDAGRLPIQTGEEVSLSRQLCVARLRAGRC